MAVVSFSLDLNFMDFIGQETQWTVGRKLMQVNDSLTSEDAGPRSSKNCTEPGKMTGALGPLSWGRGYWQEGPDLRFSSEF